MVIEFAIVYSDLTQFRNILAYSKCENENGALGGTWPGSSGGKSLRTKLPLLSLL